MEDFVSQPVRVDKKTSPLQKMLSHFRVKPSAFENENPRRKHFFKNSRLKKTFFLLLGIIVVVLIITIIFSSRPKNSISATVAEGSQTDASQVQLEKPLAQETLNKTFSFPLRDSTGKLLGTISYVIQDAEIRTQIVINGEKATSIAGREFLILNLKLTNNYQKEITINARDYVRLMRNRTDEKLAPDIHNDPVDVQAISTKYTRLGFPINTTDKDLELQVGEISGPKEIVPLQIQ